MIRDYRGELVETNVTERRNGMIQVLLGHDVTIKAMEEWLNERGLLLFKIPDGPDPEDIPLYAITPNDETLRTGRPS